MGRRAYRCGGVTSPEQVRDLARLVKGGQASVQDMARELRQWSL